MNSLRFANNARSVQINKVLSNKIQSEDLKVIQDLKEEVRFLRDIIGMRNKNGGKDAYQSIVWRLRDVEK